MMSASSSINLASDSDNEIQIVTLWDREARKEDLYKIAYSIFSERKYDSPSLPDMRDWLTVFVTKPLEDFFLNDSKQLENFKLLMQVFRMSNLSKTSCQKKWTSDFVADKLAILLVLCQQVVDERESWKMSSVIGHYAQPRTKLRRSFAALHTKYLKCELIYAKDQCQEVNRQEHTPSLNYQARGTRLQDGVLWDPEKRDLLECPICGLGCTMRLDDVHTINAYNQGARDSVMAKGGDGTFTAKSPKHGCYGYFLSCNGRTDGGNCPYCIWRVRKQGEAGQDVQAR